MCGRWCCVLSVALVAVFTLVLLKIDELERLQSWDDEDKARGGELVAVRPSLIYGANLGAFARRHFEPGDPLGQYRCDLYRGNDGRVSDHAEDREQARWFGPTRTEWRINETHTCDGYAHPLSNPLRYVNSVASESTCSLRNVDAHVTGDGDVIYVARTAISRGDELLVDYGRDFFNGDLHSANPSPPVAYVCDVASSPLHLAAARGDADVARRTLRDLKASGVADPCFHDAAADADSDAAPQETGAAVSALWLDPPLVLAIMEGHVTMVKALIAEGCSPLDGQGTPRFWSGGTALHHAAAKDRGSSMVALLVEHGVPIDAPAPSTGMTPLHVAVLKWSNQAVKALVATGSDLLRCAAEHVSGATTLHYAAMAGNCEAVGILVGAGVPVDSVGNTPDGSTALHFACYHGNARVVSALLAAGADPSSSTAESTLPCGRSTAGLSPLHVASEQGHLDTVQLLLQAGANTSAMLDDGETPLRRALQRCAAANSTDKRRPLLLSVAKALLAVDGGVGPWNAHGATELHLAVEKGDLEVVRVLIEAGADLEVATKDKMGVSALRLAAVLGRAEITSALLHEGHVEVDGTGKNGATALHVAALQAEGPDVVSLLLAAGADPTAIERTKGATPLHLAARKGKLDVVRALLAGGSNASAPDSAGRTALEWAADSEDPVAAGPVARVLRAAAAGDPWRRRVPPIRDNSEL